MEREKGWYWVLDRIHTEYDVMFWNGLEWEFKGYTLDDRHLDYISETRLEPPKDMLWENPTAISI